jgi:hypothetical protein
MNIFFYILFAICIGAILYKWKYHLSAPNIDKHPPLVVFLSKSFWLPFLLLFPLRQRPHNEADNRRRKKANLALLIFWAAFILAMLVSRFMD